MTSRTYSTGTVSIANGATTATFVGTMLTTNVEAGDILAAGGLMAFIKTVTDDTHVELETVWAGSTLTGAAYVIGKFSWDRYDPAITQAKARELLAALEGISIDPTTDVMSFDYGVAFPATVSPPQITANQNNWTIASFDDAITFRISSDAARSITGLAGGTAGRVIVLQNVGSYGITLSNESASSTAANRFAIGSNLVIGPNCSIALQYDVTSARWRAISRSFSGVYSDLTGKPTLREVLTAARTYYVRTDGSDSNNGLANTAGGSFLTIQKAIDTVATLDIGTSYVYIYVADGTYSGSIVLKPVVGSGRVYLSGNATNPENVVINASANHALTVPYNAVAPVVGWHVKGFELRNSGSGNTNVFLSDGASVTFDGPMRLGSNNGIYYGNIYTGKRSLLSFVGQALTVAASGPAFLFQAATGAQIDGRNATISFLQNTTYSGTVFAADGGTKISLGGVTWTLNGYTITTTWWRYGSISVAVIETDGGGANFIPGSTAGYTYNGGIYL